MFPKAVWLSRNRETRTAATSTVKFRAHFLWSKPLNNPILRFIVYLAVTHPSPRVCVSTADQAAPSTAAAAAAPTAATPSGGVSPQAGSTGGDKAKSGSGSGGDVSEELWIVGRFMENMDTRLGAKQEKIREFLLGCLLAERRKGEDCGCVCGIYVCLRGNVMPVRLRERACSSGPAIAAQ